MVFKFIIVYFFIYLPFNCRGHRNGRETHFPGYHFCGPGTNYLERVALGQKGVNKLDEACRQHDLVYTDSEDLRLRMEADEKLEMQAWERVKAKDSRYKEKIAAWMVMNVMKVKRKWFNRNLRTETSKKRRDLSSIESNKRRYDSTDWFGSQLPIVYQMRNAKTSENIFFRNPAYKRIWSTAYQQ